MNGESEDQCAQGDEADRQARYCGQVPAEVHHRHARCRTEEEWWEDHFEDDRGCELDGVHPGEETDGDRQGEEDQG